MQRRTLLKLGVGGTVVLAVAGGGLSLMHPGLTEGRMSEASRGVMRAVARGVLSDSLPAEPRANEKSLADHLHRLEISIAGFPAHVQSELSQMLALLSSTAGRIVVAGLSPDWHEATAQEVQAAMQSMRTSSLAIRQQVYHALRDLTNAAYFSDPSAWALIGYPGPRAI